VIQNPPGQFARPLSQDLFIDDKPGTGRLQVKRSKSANLILGSQDLENFVAQHEMIVAKDVCNENESSGEDNGVNGAEELARTKAARAQSEHRRRVELKDSFEQLRLVLEVPQPRAGKKDLVDLAVEELRRLQDGRQAMEDKILHLQQQLIQMQR
jgi:hypothetical protein